MALPLRKRKQFALEELHKGEVWKGGREVENKGSEKSLWSWGLESDWKNCDFLNPWCLSKWVIEGRQSSGVIGGVMRSLFMKGFLFCLQFQSGKTPG